MKSIFNSATALFASLLLSGCALFGPSLASETNTADWQSYQSGLSNELQALVFGDAQATTKGIIFYPGGKVEPEAYGRLADALAIASKRLVVITPMPLDLAILKGKAGQKIRQQLPLISDWVIAGHSLGGVIAASQAHQPDNNWQGLILLASYPQEKHDFTDSQLPVLSIIGNNDTVVDRELWQTRQALLPKSSQVVTLEGGNHAGFGHYGNQAQDSAASITPEQQQQKTVDLIVQWLSFNQL